MRGVVFVGACLCLLNAGQLAAQTPENTPFQVSADHDGTDTTGYRLYRSASGTTSQTPLATLPVSSLTNNVIVFQVTGWPAGAYDVQVSAYNSAGEARSVPLPVTITGTAPPPPPPPPQTSTPYGGAPAILPGVVQAENFDEGGEGLAFHDTSGANDGGAYRPTAVDLQPTSDAGGGYNVGWMYTTEWLIYSVNVQTAGLYTLTVRVASPTLGGTFRLESDGVDITGPMQVPVTGDWQNWVTVTKTGVPLTSGNHRLRFLVLSDTNGIFGNLNWLFFARETSTPPPPPPPGVPGTVGNLAVTNTSAGLVTLSWTEVGDGAGAPAKYEARQGSPWSAAQQISAGSCVSPILGATIGALRSCTVSGLAASTAYQFQLVAYRGTLNVDAVFGGLSNVVSVTTPAVTPPPSPPATAAAPIVTGGGAATCPGYVLTAARPTGWTTGTAQFQINNTNGTFTNVGSADPSSPYARTTARLIVGTYQFSVLWTRSGADPVRSAVATVSCGS